MGVGVAPQRFCRVCGAGHDPDAGCPGELRATGAEVPGWRVEIDTPYGHEAIGVLLAPSHDQWRARIITHPRALWTVPGSRETLKFVGSSREEAEAHAIAFIERHVRAKQLTRTDRTAASEAGRMVPRSGLPAGRRKMRAIPVRFGSDRVLKRGVTFNVSTEGMFIRVPEPEEAGRSLLIHFDIQDHTLAMYGFVMWNRHTSAPNRPVGMGIRLSSPPSLYQSYVASLL